MPLICDFWCGLIVHRFETKSTPTVELGNLFYSVIYALAKFTIYPNDVFVLINSGDFENIKNNNTYSTVEEYRSHIREFLIDSSVYLGFSDIYNRFIYPEIEKCIDSIKIDQNNIGVWSYLESLVFILYSISKSIDKNENFDFLDRLINTLIEIPDNMVRIRLTFIDLIDQLSGFLIIK